MYKRQLLDEPTSGLDPLMQNNFIDLIEREKKKGKTILLSSHIFEEVEKTCDRVGMIQSGRLIKEFTIDDLRHSQMKTYKIGFNDISDAERIKRIYPDASFNREKKQMTVSLSAVSYTHLDVYKRQAFSRLPFISVVVIKSCISDKVFIRYS